MSKTLSAKDVSLYWGRRCKIVNRDSSLPPQVAPNGSIVLISLSTLALIKEGSIIVKPILRKQDSITEIEARDIYRICTKESWTSNAEEMWERECLSGYWNYFDEWYCPQKYQIIGNPAGWAYLLEHGFDIFEWIEQGLAIDEKTLEL